MNLKNGNNSGFNADYIQSQLSIPFVQCVFKFEKKRNII